MNKNFFKSVYIIGTGSLPLHILKIITNFNIENNIGLKIIPVSYHEITNSTYERYCLKNNSHFKKFTKKEELNNYLLKIEEKSLVISANNYFIFTKEIVEKENLEIVNFHNSLLPKHRGLNAALWAIIERDKYTGITWHKIDKDIDNGNIIYQEKYKIKNNETFFSLTKKLLDMGVEFIKNNFKKLLNYDYRNCELKNEIKKSGGELRYFNDLPNNGYLDINTNVEDIDLYLRAFDDGFLGIIPNLKIEKDGIIYEIIGYKYNDDNSSFNEDYELEYCIKIFKLYLKKIV